MVLRKYFSHFNPVREVNNPDLRKKNLEKSNDRLVKRILSILVLVILDFLFYWSKFQGIQLS
jgi:hypothetical protein